MTPENLSEPSGMSVPRAPSEPCRWCGDAIFGIVCRMPHLELAEDRESTERPVRVVEHSYHPECRTRMILGGLNHLAGRCTCCGGTQPPDPPELTTRQAALAAVDYWIKVLHRVCRGRYA